MADPETYLLEEARTHDRDRYLCALFAPVERREALLALILFNHELARVPEIASEPIVGMIRYQWWRDALDEVVEGRPRRHPVVEAIAEATANGTLDVADLRRLIDAREHEVDRLQPENLDTLDAYIASTSGYLCRLMDGVATQGAAGDAARHAGCAYGLVGVVRAVKAHARQDRTLLPQDLTERAGLGKGIRSHDITESQLKAAIEPILNRAGTHLDAMKNTTTGRSPALLLGSIARRQLSKARSHGSPGEPAPLPWLPFELGLRNLLGRF